MFEFLTFGDIIMTTRVVNKSVIQTWKYSNECQNHGGGYMTGVFFRIEGMCSIQGDRWLKARIRYSNPPQFLKITEQEFVHNFRYWEYEMIF
jgi:hypothetical protein